MITYSSCPPPHCLARLTERLPVTAWKPVLMVWTLQREWHDMHWRKKSLVSLARMVSGDRHVWQVTYSWKDAVSFVNRYSLAIKFKNSDSSVARGRACESRSIACSLTSCRNRAKKGLRKVVSCSKWPH